MTDKTPPPQEDLPPQPAAPAKAVEQPKEVQPTVVEKPAMAKTPDSKPGNRRAGLALAVSVLALIVGLGGSGYLGFSLYQQRSALETSRVDMAAAALRAESQAGQMRELQQQLDQARLAAGQREKQLQQQLENLQRQLASQQTRLQSLTTTDRADWLLAEAEYLIRLANQRLLMGKELAGAQDLLKAADDIMRELDDAGLFQVRKALANDIAQLKAAARFDLEGLYLQLEAAAEQGDQLTLFAMPQLQLQPAEAESPANWQEKWQAGLVAAWEKLSQYIQIKRRDEVYKPLLAPEHESAVRQNLRLSFEQAQLAALSGRQTIYEDSLKQARYWLDNFYTLDKAAAQALVKTVNDLGRQQVTIELPDISGSLRALQDYLDTVHEVSSKPQLEPVQKTANGSGHATEIDATENAAAAVEAQP